jgi:16S rRNA (uracil1498-N3)-methyltransferase
MAAAVAVAAAVAAETEPMPPRLFCDLALRPRAADAAWELPEGAARHAQVLRVQPGALLTLFDGLGGEWRAEVTDMTRRGVAVRLLAHDATEREAARAVHLAVGMPTGERMDALVEKATELGAASVQPLMCARSVLRLSGERAARRQAHWQAVAVAACEQSGRNRVPVVHAPRELADWLDASAWSGRGMLLTLAPDAPGVPSWAHEPALTCVSGPEGGLTPEEEAGLLAAGFARASLGPRVLRADTAPLAALTLLACA